MAEDPGQIRQAITETRSEIADTVQALGQKADVKSRLSGAVEEKSAEIRSKATALQEQARRKLPESAQPKADAAFESARQAACGVASDPAKKRAVAMASGGLVFLMLLRGLMRRRRH